MPTFDLGLVKGPKGDPGDRGAQGIQGVPGPQGDPGYTPVRGTDYFTEADKQDLADAAAEKVVNESVVGQILGIDTTPTSGSGNLVTSGGVYTSLANKENSFSVLPLNKGGTGVQNLTALRREVGIGFLVSCGAGKSINITLPDNGSYLICSNDNVRLGAILVQAGSTFGAIKRVTVLSSPLSWSYTIGNNVLTLSETGGEYDGGFWITSLSMYAYSGG